MRDDFLKLSELLTATRQGINTPGTSATDFEEEPVPLQVFIRDAKYLDSPELSEKQYDLVARGTQIYFAETLVAMGLERFSFFKELVAMWGKGGGKDHCARIIIARIAYLLLCLKKPQAYYGLPGTSTIGFINMARSAPQANNVFFTPLKRMVTTSPWFRNRLEPHQATIEFDKNLIAISGHSEMEQHEGYDLIAGVLDEIAAFKTDKECEVSLKRSQRQPMASARAVYEGVKSSITSRFPLVGKLILISYTRFRGDFIWQRYWAGKAEAECAIREGREPAIYTTYARTWESHPLRRREDFDDEYRRDPAKARAKYECDPPLAEDAFFKDVDKLRSPDIWRPAVSNPLVNMVDEVPRLRDEYRANHTFKCGAHIDLALRRDAAGLAVVHQSAWNDRVIMAPGGVSKGVQEPVLTIDLVCRFKSPRAGLEIDIDSVIGMIYQMISRGFNIRLVSMDGYQSAQAIQTFTKSGVEAKIRRLQNDIGPWNNLKDLIYGKRLLGYVHPSVVNELEALAIINAKKVDHTDISTKDEAEALAGACESAIELGCAAGSHYANWSGGANLFGSSGASSPFADNRDAFENGHLTAAGVEGW